MELVLIAAISENHVIGAGGRIPWHISEDLQRFKRLTMDHPIVMGRKTYESLGKPLLGRLNMVLSRQPGYLSEGREIREGIHVYRSLDEAIALLSEGKPVQAGIKYDTAFIIGGESVYREALPIADRLEITRVCTSVPGDAFFPEISAATWMVRRRDDRLDYSFITYVKREPL